MNDLHKSDDRCFLWGWGQIWTRMDEAIQPVVRLELISCKIWRRIHCLIKHHSVKTCGGTVPRILNLGTSKHILTDSIFPWTVLRVSKLFGEMTGKFFLCTYNYNYSPHSLCSILKILHFRTSITDSVDLHTHHSQKLTSCLMGLDPLTWTTKSEIKYETYSLVLFVPTGT
jgi:hypothetical protein